MRLLIVEDNKELGRLLVDGFQKVNFESDLVTTAREALSALTSMRYAAAILDLGLPDADGLSIVRELRDQRDPIPVLILTARDLVSDRIAGLSAGADDYMAKPFAFEEVVARLHALLRRPGNLLGNSVSLGNLTFDTASRQILIDQLPQIFFDRETDLLELLLRRKGHIVPKKMLEDQLFGNSGNVASNAVEVYVHRLRKKLERLGARVEVHTVRGVGYIIVEATNEPPC